MDRHPDSQNQRSGNRTAAHALSVAPDVAREPRSLWSDARSRLLRNPVAMAGGAVVILLIIVAVGIFSVPLFARVTRGQVLSLKQQDFILAARMMGAQDSRIMLNHLLPNAVAPLLVLCTLRIATAILTAASLSFLGPGAQPPTPEWGAMLSDGRAYLTIAPHVATIPGLAILLAVLAFNLLGDGLRDALDPRLRV